MFKFPDMYSGVVVAVEEPLSYEVIDSSSSGSLMKTSGVSIILTGHCWNLLKLTTPQNPANAKRNDFLARVVERLG